MEGRCWVAVLPNCQRISTPNEAGWPPASESCLCSGLCETRPSQTCVNGRSSLQVACTRPTSNANRCLQNFYSKSSGCVRFDTMGLYHVSSIDCHLSILILRSVKETNHRRFLTKASHTYQSRTPTSQLKQRSSCECCPTSHAIALDIVSLNDL